MKNLPGEKADLALTDAGIKLLNKGKPPVRHTFFTREQSVTSAISAKFGGRGGGCIWEPETVNCCKEKGVSPISRNLPEDMQADRR